MAARSGGHLQQGRRYADGAGGIDEALQAYRDGLAVAGHLAAADRSNTLWQRDLSLSYEKVGDVLMAQGKLEEALEAYRESLSIQERLATA